MTKKFPKISFKQQKTKVLSHSSFFTDEDVVTCTATATDSFDGTVTESQSIAIGNTMPVIGSVSIDPANPFSQDTLTCTANDVTDIDGDDVTVSYTWTIDGVEQTLDPEQEQNMLFGPFTVGAIIGCGAEPNDGKTDGEIVEASAEVQNTEPVVESVTITPSEDIEANAVLLCEATASDVDGEELTSTYSWTNQDGTELGTDAEITDQKPFHLMMN